MKHEIVLERIFPHPVDKVWRALTEPAALGAWLMETDFAPEPGRAFEMRCDDGDGGTDRYACALLAYEPPRRMLWSWRAEDGGPDAISYVEFRVEPVDGGTRVTIRHSSERDDLERFESGWPHKLDQLADWLAGGVPGESPEPS